jgi:hypothetical protein
MGFFQGIEIPTVGFTRWRAEVDNPWEQEKPEASLAKRVEGVQSAAVSHKWSNPVDRRGAARGISAAILWTNCGARPVRSNGRLCEFRIRSGIKIPCLFVSLS